jgi:hypothetical protein
VSGWSFNHAMAGLHPRPNAQCRLIAVTPVKTWSQESMKKLDSRFHGKTMTARLNHNDPAPLPWEIGSFRMAWIYII